MTGAARGQGREHAIRLAAEGADVVALDLAAQIPSVPYDLARPEDLAETVRRVEALGGRCLPWIADVRDIRAVGAGVAAGVAEFGHLDLVVANAGVLLPGRWDESPEEALRDFTDAVGVLLTGVFTTLFAVRDVLIEQGTGGAVVVTGSEAGVVPLAAESGGMAGYTAAQHGVIGLMRSFAKVLGPHDVRVNCVNPSGVATDMVLNSAFERFTATRVAGGPRAKLLPRGLLDVADVSHAVLWLLSDEARHITGATLSIDGGSSIG